MTYKEALENGYKIIEERFQQGYISRKTDIMQQKVLTAEGKRKGDLYILAPCRCSTRYCFRFYLGRNPNENI